MCALRWSVRAQTTLPKALRDLFIILPSSMVRPSVPVLSCLSDPGRIVKTFQKFFE